ncbi:MAG TPA: hypothetical protein VMZ91_03715 [Candidatus Paceibacterota bacterium]|nr:hypothetical protein [Candidatus Paceibacterota bacterium]
MEEELCRQGIFNKMKKGCLNEDRIKEFAEHATQEEVKRHYLYGCLRCVGYNTCVDYIESNENCLNKKRKQQAEDL